MSSGKRAQLHTKDSEGKSSERILWPLGTIGWGDRWTLLAWCEKRVAYRNFRFDRIQDITVLAERYPLHQQRNLEHYLTQIEGMKDEQKHA